jgi:alkylation response protein AidB-like acyl-CoA dehydrogenase
MFAMTVAEAVSRARHLAETVLFPSAMDVDAADIVPATHLDALAAAGLYGIAGPPEAGGAELDVAPFGQVVEILAGGCLATTFAWLQHHGVVRAVTGSGNARLRSAWLEPLCAGRRRAAIALAGGRPGPPLLRATRVPGGYQLDGTAPWVTGWDLVDVLYTLARTEDGQLVAALLPAQRSQSLSVRRLSLVAVNASMTVELSFDGYFVPDALVCSISPQAQWLAQDAQGLRPNGSLSLGVAGRCCQLIGPSPLDGELAAVRAQLDAADTDSLPAARATASEFVFRAASTAVTASGSRGILTGQHPQRLAREATFLLVFGSRPAIKESLLGRLTTVAR